MGLTTANKVADYFVFYFQSKEKGLNNQKLQKLLYYAQGWYLGLYDTPLFDDELQAWIAGSVQPDVNERFRNFHHEPITEKMKNPTFGRTNIKRFLNELLRIYGDYDEFYLERTIHNEPPWQNARVGLQSTDPGINVISVEDMRTYFSRRSEEPGD